MVCIHILRSALAASGSSGLVKLAVIGCSEQLSKAGSLVALKDRLCVLVPNKSCWLVHGQQSVTRRGNCGGRHTVYSCFVSAQLGRRRLSEANHLEKRNAMTFH
jgi:hypothetical protein